MIIPIRDILSTEPGQPWVLGRYGLVINLRGHEELFFEFAYEERRGVFARLLDHQLGLVPAPGPGAEPEPELRAAHIFDDFEPGSTASVSASASSDLEHSALDPMFTSASSTFLRIKPEKPLHFTFLTIGSRGDVQPYIALAKGLMAEGHRCRIATHGEFKDWIEGVCRFFGLTPSLMADFMHSKASSTVTLEATLPS
jgi:sterol 3beta-glucosyltransferase